MFLSPVNGSLKLINACIDDEVSWHNEGSMLGYKFEDLGLGGGGGGFTDARTAEGPVL